MANNETMVLRPDAKAHRKSPVRSGIPYRKILRNYELYLFILPAFIYFILFHYGPLYGIQIAFKDFMSVKGIWGSPWVGMQNFMKFFNSHYFWVLIKNTLSLSVYSLAAGFPLPIILALMLNELKNKRFKKVIENAAYAPHFISTVVLAGMILTFLSPSTGIVNEIIKALGGNPISFMTKSSLFKHIYVWSGIWQNLGWNSIIFTAALSGIDPELHEAAIVDGATRFQRILHIDIPGIMPTMIIMLIMDCGKVMSVGFEKVFLLQNPLNMEVSDVISTYVYRIGLLNAQYSFSTAVGLFNSVINFVLLVLVNSIARRVSETSLW
jgi:putative aldouronate transport system permease protein